MANSEKIEISNIQIFKVSAVGWFIPTTSETAYTLCAEIEGKIKEICSFKIKSGLDKDPISDFLIDRNSFVKLAITGGK